MKKNTLRRLALGLALCFGAMTLFGCRSTIGPAIEEAKRRAQVHEIDVSDMFSEESGFHYPGYVWGHEFSEFQKAADFPITGIAGYSEDGTFYDCSEWNVKIGELQNDGATVAADMEERVQLVLFEFDGDKTSLSTELFENFAEEIGKNFEIKPSVEERDDQADNATYHYVTYYWRYTMEDGKETSLQWAAAYVKGAENPSAMTFSLSYIAPEESNETK